jgi:hypothetical protein
MGIERRKRWFLGGIEFLRYLDLLLQCPPDFFRVHQNSSESTRILQSPPEYSRVHQTSPEFTRLL